MKVDILDFLSFPVENKGILDFNLTNCKNFQLLCLGDLFFIFFLSQI